MIYFIQSVIGGPIKIGFTTNITQRLIQLQNTSPFTLVVLATMDGSAKDEEGLHARFAKHRLHGEWFSPKVDLCKFIRDLGGQPKRSKVTTYDVEFFDRVYKDTTTQRVIP